MKYEINYTDHNTGSTSPIDNVDYDGILTAEKYVELCRENADPEWIKMIESGTVTVIAVDETRMKYNLVDESGNILKSFEQALKPYRRNRPAERTPEYEQALTAWRDSDNLHFEDEDGNTLDPFSLMVEN